MDDHTHGDRAAHLEQQAQLPEANPFPVLRVGQDGTILYMNPAARRFAADLGGGADAIRRVLPDDFDARIGRLIDEKRTVLEEQHEALGRHMLLNYQPLPDTRQIFVSIVDVTKRVVAQQQVRAYAAELEAINRALKETQLQLVHSQKLAALGDLVAGVAHEMNTPVASIRSNAEVAMQALAIIRAALMDQELAEHPKLDRALSTLERLSTDTSIAADRIVDIITALRNFARLDESEFKRVDLHEGIDSTLALLGHRTQGRIRVVKRYNELPRIGCYPRQLNQVFMHLLVNAIEAIERAPGGGAGDAAGVITIETRLETEQVVIAFTDNGIGIVERDLPYVFEPGFTRRGLRVGIGLGLATTYRVMQHHNGDVTIQSSPGKGTTITLMLPVV